MSHPLVKDYIKSSVLPVWGLVNELPPWEAVASIESLVKALSGNLDLSQYRVSENQYVHKTAIVEPNAQLKGAVIIGPSCFVANGSLLRDGVVMDAGCIVGHCGELKTSLMFSGSKIAHLNFVGDSVLGNSVNLEAGAMIVNYRNERADKEITVSYQNRLIRTGVEKFGALVGDEARIGANATIAPGCLINENGIVLRGSAIDNG